MDEKLIEALNLIGSNLGRIADAITKAQAESLPWDEVEAVASEGIFAPPAEETAYRYVSCFSTGKEMRETGLAVLSAHAVKQTDNPNVYDIHYYDRQGQIAAEDIKGFSKDGQTGEDVVTVALDRDDLEALGLLRGRMQDLGQPAFLRQEMKFDVQGNLIPDASQDERFDVAPTEVPTATLGKIFVDETPPAFSVVRENADGTYDVAENVAGKLGDFRAATAAEIDLLRSHGIGVFAHDTPAQPAESQRDG